MLRCYYIFQHHSPKASKSARKQLLASGLTRNEGNKSWCLQALQPHHQMLSDHIKRSLVERGGVLVWSGSFVEHGGLVGKANGRLVIMAIDHFKDMLLYLSQRFPLFVSWLNMSRVRMSITQHRSIIHHFEYYFQNDNSLLLVPISSSFLARL